MLVSGGVGPDRGRTGRRTLVLSRCLCGMWVSAVDCMGGIWLRSVAWDVASGVGVGGDGVVVQEEAVHLM